MQLWCNESQERYVLGVAQERLAEFAAICARERCPFAAVGVVTEEERLVVGFGATPDSLAPGPAQRAERSDEPRSSAAQAARLHPIDLPMDVLFGKPPKMHRDTAHPPAPRWPALETAGLDLHDAALRVMAHPSVASKQFLVTMPEPVLTYKYVYTISSIKQSLVIMPKPLLINMYVYSVPSVNP
jgi:phosphoribosylformylglycinamidine synthase